MEKLYTILLEIGIFLTLALLYYSIQKRRILKQDLSENLSHLYNILKDETKVEEIKELIKEQGLNRAIDLINSLELDDQYQDDLNEIKQNLSYHVKR